MLTLRRHPLYKRRRLWASWRHGVMASAPSFIYDAGWLQGLLCRRVAQEYPMERQSVVEEKMTRLLFLSLLLVETSSYVLLKADTRPKPLGGVSVDMWAGCWGYVLALCTLYHKWVTVNSTVRTTATTSTYGSFI